MYYMPYLAECSLVSQGPDAIYIYIYTIYILFSLHIFIIHDALQEHDHGVNGEPYVLVMFL